MNMDDPIEIQLERELEDAERAIAGLDERIARMRLELAQAQDEEGRALAAHGEATATAARLSAATVAGTNALYVAEDDEFWKIEHPAARAAVNARRGAADVLQAASARTLHLSKDIEHLEVRGRPVLHGARDDKRHELDQHRARVAAARAQLTSKPSLVDRLKGTLNGHR